MPGGGIPRPDQLGHVEQPPIVMEQYLAGSLLSLVYEGAVCRIGDADGLAEEPCQRSQVVAQRIAEVFVPHDHRRDSGEDVVAGEEGSGERVPEADVRRVMTRGVHHLQPAAIAQVDAVPVDECVVRGLDGGHVVGPGHLAGHDLEDVGRDAVRLADPVEPFHVARGVVVAVDQLGCSIMHHESTAPLAHETRRHPDMVEMEMRHHQGVDRVLTEPESAEPLPDRPPSGLPIGPAVEHQEPTAGLDDIGVDPGRALERERCRDEMDAVPQRLWGRGGHPCSTGSLIPNLMSRVTVNTVGAPESSTFPPTLTILKLCMSEMVLAALARTVRTASSIESLA